MANIRVSGPEALKVGPQQLRDMYEKRVTTGLAQEPRLPGIQEESGQAPINKAPPLNAEKTLEFLRKKMDTLSTIQNGHSLNSADQSQAQNLNIETPGLLSWFRKRFGKILQK